MAHVAGRTDKTPGGTESIRIGGLATARRAIFAYGLFGFIVTLMGLRGPQANPRPAQLLRLALSPNEHVEFTCDVCTKPFVRHRISAKFCSDRCRQKNYRDRQRRKAARRG